MQALEKVRLWPNPLAIRSTPEDITTTTPEQQTQTSSEKNANETSESTTEHTDINNPLNTPIQKNPPTNRLNPTPLPRPNPPPQKRIPDRRARRSNQFSRQRDRKYHLGCPEERVSGAYNCECCASGGDVVRC